VGAEAQRRQRARQEHRRPEDQPGAVEHRGQGAAADGGVDEDQRHGEAGDPEGRAHEARRVDGDRRALVGDQGRRLVPPRGQELVAPLGEDVFVGNAVQGHATVLG
jgi:hypothetical protein